MTSLLAPNVRVVLDDGKEWDVQTGNQDMVAWDVTAAKHKWPGIKDAPVLWLTFLAWHASRRKRLGPDPDMTWETFKARAESISSADDDDSDGDGLSVADPTLSGLEPD